MKNFKNDFNKIAIAGLIAASIIGMTGCSGHPEIEPAFGIEDLPLWVREMTNDEDWQMFFNELTVEELELFFTEGLGAQHEMPTQTAPGSGQQMKIVAPGQGDSSGGGMIFTDDGWEDIGQEELDDLLETINN